MKRMYSIDSAGNRRMCELAASLGFDRTIDPQDPGEVIHSLALDTATTLPNLPGDSP